MATRILNTIVCISLAAGVYAAAADGPCSAHYLAMHRSSGGAAAGHGMRALACLRSALSNGAPEILLYRYADTVSTMYFSLDIGSCDEKKKAYRDALAAIERSSTNTNTSAIYHLSAALLLARIIDCADTLEIAGGGYADRVRYHLDRCLSNSDPFRLDLAYLFYGRLHAIAPHVPVFQSWPDKAAARAYFERSLAIEPNSYIARFFYADLLYETGSRDRAIRMFREISRAVPSADDRVSDTKTIAMCKARMKALGIPEQ